MKNRIFALVALAAFAGLGACRADEPAQEVEIYPATETTTPAIEPAEPVFEEPAMEEPIEEEVEDTVPAEM